MYKSNSIEITSHPKKVTFIEPKTLIGYTTNNHQNYDNDYGYVLPRFISLEFSDGSTLSINSEKWNYGDSHGLGIQYESRD